MRFNRLIAILLISALAGASYTIVWGGEPRYATNGDTVYLGNTLIIKAKDIPPLPSPGALTGTAGSGMLTNTTWGPEMQLTHLWQDSSSLTQQAWATVWQDTVFIVFSTAQSWSGTVPYMMSSFDGGDAWSDMWCITNNDTAQEAINVFVNYYNHRVNVGGKFVWSHEYDYYNTYTKYSNDLGQNWSAIHYCLIDRGHQYMGFLGGISHLDTLLFGFHDGLDYFGRRIDTIMTTYSVNNGTTWSELHHGPWFHQNNSWFWFKYSLGRIHLVYQERSPNTNLSEVFYAHSDDWGQSWSNSIIVSDDSSQHSQWPYLYATDDGKLIASWFDYKYGSGGSGFTGDILYRLSTDNGESWGEELQLTDNHQATASMTFINGDQIGVVWEDGRSGFLTPELYYTESFDFGRTWSEEYRLTNAPGTSESPRLYLSDGKLYLFWSDARENPPFGNEVFFRKGDIEVSVTDDNNELPRFVVLSCYPNPFNSSVSFSIKGYEGGDAKIKIYDIRGSFVKGINRFDKEGKTTWDATDNIGRKVSSGIYFAQVETPQGKSSAKLLLLR